MCILRALNQSLDTTAPKPIYARSHIEKSLSGFLSAYIFQLLFYINNHTLSFNSSLYPNTVLFFIKNPIHRPLGTYMFGRYYSFASLSATAHVSTHFRSSPIGCLSSNFILFQEEVRLREHVSLEQYLTHSSSLSVKLPTIQLSQSH